MERVKKMERDGNLCLKHRPILISSIYIYYSVSRELIYVTSPVRNFARRHHSCLCISANTDTDFVSFFLSHEAVCRSCLTSIFLVP